MATRQDGQSLCSAALLIGLLLAVGCGGEKTAEGTVEAAEPVGPSAGESFEKYERAVQERPRSAGGLSWAASTTPPPYP